MSKPKTKTSVKSKQLNVIIPAKLHGKLKIKAAEKGETMTELCTKLLKKVNK